MPDLIPHVLHQMWAGDAEPPTAMMQTWTDRNPEWEPMLWDDYTIAAFGLRNQEIYDRFVERGWYFGASDIVRCEALLRYGGVWADADTECLLPLEGDFLSSGFFACEPYDREPRRLLTSIIGAVPGHGVLERWSAIQGAAMELFPAWRTVGGVALRMAVDQGDEMDVMVLPATMFYHRTARGLPIPEDGPRYAKHYYGSTVWQEVTDV